MAVFGQIADCFGHPVDQNRIHRRHFARITRQNIGGTAFTGNTVVRTGVHTVGELHSILFIEFVHLFCTAVQIIRHPGQRRTEHSAFAVGIQKIVLPAVETFITDFGNQILGETAFVGSVAPRTDHIFTGDTLFQQFFKFGFGAVDGVGKLFHLAAAGQSQIAVADNQFTEFCRFIKTAVGVVPGAVFFDVFTFIITLGYELLVE